MAQRKPSSLPTMPPWTPARPLAAIPWSAPKRANTSPSTTPKKPARKSPTSSSIFSEFGAAGPCLTRLIDRFAAVLTIVRCWPLGQVFFPYLLLCHLLLHRVVGTEKTPAQEIGRAHV